MYIRILDNVLYHRLRCASPSWTLWVNLTPACMTCTGCPATPTVRETEREWTALYDTCTHILIYHTHTHIYERADASACKGWSLQRLVMVRCLLVHVPTSHCHKRVICEAEKDSWQAIGREHTHLKALYTSASDLLHPDQWILSSI